MATRKKVDSGVQKVMEVLQREYGSKHPRAKIEVYRYNPASIRIRIIDPDFKGLDRVQRDDVIWPLLQMLPENVRSDITVVLLITPSERRDSIMSLEFDDPSPSRL